MNTENSSNRGFDRRRFLTSTTLGGATVVGATALGGVDAEAAFAATTPSLAPGISQAAFAEGLVEVIGGSVLQVSGSDGQRHRVQLTNGTSVWKLTHTTAAAIRPGDGLYARGVTMPDGTIAADAVWVNIVNLFCSIRRIGRDRIDLRHGEHAVLGRVVRGTTVASYAGRAATNDLSRLRIDQHVQVLGAWRPADDSIDVAKLTTGH